MVSVYADDYTLPPGSGACLLIEYSLVKDHSKARAARKIRSAAMHPSQAGGCGRA
jgi:hypothetical protein